MDNLDFMRFDGPKYIADLKSGKAVSYCSEWRMCTVTVTEILPGPEYFLVKVSCDYEMSAKCPTPERAIEIAQILEKAQRDFFYDHGWPSWKSKGVL